ncbi:MAG: hypothetical protein QF926_05265 [Alphaproteobacteria bacterium]|jgi:hypothetical protein|nr:hypothetical protein [Alphaproteobacteria bacterium]MDP6516020.1 hypothetical protein [Alphaproteobacteria bacterium]
MESLTAITFTPALPWPLLVVLAALATPVVGLALWTRARGGGPRALVLAVAFLALLNPTLIDEERQRLPDVGVLVIDESESQAIGDRSAQTARAAQALRAELDSGHELELRVVTVGPSGSDDGTRLFEALGRALADVPTELVAGTILITDGQVHDVPENLAGIAYAGPVHLLLTGAPDARDRRLVIAEAPSYGIVGDILTLAVRVDDPGAEGAAIPITIRADGGRPRRVPVRIGELTELNYSLERAGITALEIAVAPGAAELTLDNNRAVVVINGVRDRLRVMLVSGEPSPGLRTWRNLLKADPSVDLIHFTILRPPNKQDLTPVRELSLIPFPSGELFAANLDEFDLIIFDRYHRRGILPLVYLSNVVDYVIAGGAVLDTAGPSFASPFSLATTPLGAILPGQPTGGLHEEAFRPRLTAAGRRHPVTAQLPGSGVADRATDDGAAEPRWGHWFRLMEAEVSRGTILMRGGRDLPVLVLDRVGEGRVAQLLSDQSWLWARGFDGGGPQSDLLRRLVHWLMKQPDLEEDSLTATVAGDRIEIARRSLAPIAGEVAMRAPDGTTQSVPLRPAGEGRAVATLTAPGPGLYRLDHADQSAIAVVGTANPLEMADVRATEAVLAPIAEATGGAVMWLGISGIPDLRRVRADARRHGHDWIGLLANRQYLVSGLNQVPLLPAALLLALLIGGLMLAWRREGR